MSSQRLSKAAVAIGGFLIFMGITMLGVFILTLLDVVDVSIFERMLWGDGYRVMFLVVLLVIGILDVVSGIILRRM